MTGDAESDGAEASAAVATGARDAAANGAAATGGAERSKPADASAGQVDMAAASASESASDSEEESSSEESSSEEDSDSEYSTDSDDERERRIEEARQCAPLPVASACAKHLSTKRHCLCVRRKVCQCACIQCRHARME